MGPFPPSKKCEYILVAVDYVSKWVEALPCKNANNISSKRMFEEIIFPIFEVPRIVISDGGSHFINKRFKQYLSNTWDTSQCCYSLPPLDKWPSRDIKQTNQEYSVEDSK
jgi:hypothetical protein